MRTRYYPPINTQPANVRDYSGLPASMPSLLCLECGRPSVDKYCDRCREPGLNARERRQRARQAEYLAALAAWESEGGALPPVDPCLTLKQRGLKRCTACGAELPLGWFRSAGKNKLRGKCRLCEHPQRSKENAIRRQRAYFGRALPAKVPADVVRKLMVRQGYRCACGCGASVLYVYHLDHRIPLKRGGRHVFSNLQLLSPPCNLRKGAS